MKMFYNWIDILADIVVTAKSVIVIDAYSAFAFVHRFINTVQEFEAEVIESFIPYLQSR